MNGRELTAKDIEYNWHRLATLGSGFTEPPARFGSIPNVPFESITATDDWTVVFKLKQPMLSALKIILDDAWTWILPPEVIKEHGDVADWRNVVGIGKSQGLQEGREKGLEKGKLIGQIHMTQNLWHPSIDSLGFGPGVP